MADILAALAGPPAAAPSRSFSFEDFFSFSGYPLVPNPFQTLRGDREEIDGSFAGYVDGAYKSNGVVFAVELVRLQVFSEARFMFRQLDDGRPGDLFWTPALDPLRRPWPNATTGDLLTRAIVDADLAGNHFAVRRGRQIKRLRPDWVTILLGGGDSSIDPVHDPDANVIGYLYHPGGLLKAVEPIVYLAGEVAHWAPIPDPLANYRGMSWLTPVIRDIQTDKQATQHKAKFFENGATPNMVVSLGEEISPERFQKWVELFNEKHQGIANAYKTLFLGGGADATVVGADFQQLDFKATQGAGETRIAAAGGIHPTVIGLSEGLQGASLNAGNYAAARRSTADRTFRPLWRDLAGSYETIVRPPSNAELWVDLDGVAFLREDQKDAADIEAVKGQTIRQLIEAGFEPDSVVSAVTSEDMRLLSHTGKVSVQLQDPNAATASDDDAPVDGLTADQVASRGLPEDFKLRFDSVGLLIRSGFKPQAALSAVGLDPIEHFDLLPVTLQNPSKLLDDAPAPDLGGLEPNVQVDDLDPESEVDPDVSDTPPE